MKIAITGHSKGIGNKIYESLLKEGHTVKGFSRTNGWDLTILKNRNDFINELADFDCFINNAYPHKFYQSIEGFIQVDLLNQAWLKWEKDPTKVIINISSGLTDTVKNYYHPASIHKIALDETCKQLRSCRSWPHIVNLRPGYTDTDRIKNKSNLSKINLDDLAEIILFILNSKVKVYELTFAAFEERNNG